MLNDKNYSNLSGYSIIEVMGESCVSCYTMMPILEDISKRFDINFYVVEANEESKNLINQYDVTSVPSILLLHDNELLGLARGYQPNEILEIWIDAKIDEHKRKMRY